MSLNAKQLDERIRKREEALQKVLQLLEQEIETIRKNEEIIEAIRLQINLPSPSVKPALSDAPTEDPTPQSDDSPLSASKSDDSQLEAPSTDMNPPGKKGKKNKKKKGKKKNKKKQKQKMTPEEQEGCQVARMMIEQVGKIAMQIGGTLNWLIECFCKALPGIATFIVDQFNVGVRCLGKPAIAIFRKAWVPSCRLAIIASLIYNYDWTWYFFSSFASLLYTAAKAAGIALFNLPAILWKSYGVAKESVENATQMFNQTVHKVCDAVDQDVYWTNMKNNLKAGGLDPVKDAKIVANFTAMYGKKLNQEGVFSAGKFVYSNFEKDFVEPLKRALVASSLGVMKFGIDSLAITAGDPLHTAKVLAGPHMVKLILSARDYVTMSFNQMLKRLPSIKLPELPGTLRSKITEQLKLPSVPTLRFGNTAMEKALVDMSDMIVRIAHGNDNYLQIDYYNTNRYTPGYLGYNAEHMEVTLGRIDIQLQQLHGMSNIPGNADIFVGNQKPGGLLEWAKGLVSDRPTNLQTLQQSVGTLQKTLLDYKEQNELYKSLQSQWQAFQNADPTDGSIDALNDEMNVLRTIANGIQSVQNHPAVKAVVNSALRLKGSGPWSCPNVESMNVGTNSLLFAVLGTMQTTIVNLLDKYDKNKATIKGKLRQEKEVIDRKRLSMEKEGWQLSLDNQGHRDVVPPNPDLPMLGWSGGSQAQPGQLAIAAPVVADPHAKPLQRPMRVDYASATTNLVNAKYKVEECEEEN